MSRQTITYNSIMHLLSEWEGRTGKYIGLELEPITLARGHHGAQIERCEPVRGLCS